MGQSPIINGVATNNNVLIPQSGAGRSRLEPSADLAPLWVGPPPPGGAEAAPPSAGRGRGPNWAPWPAAARHGGVPAAALVAIAAIWAAEQPGDPEVASSGHNCVGASS